MRDRIYRKKRKIVLLATTMLVISTFSGGCGKKEKETEAPTEVVTAEVQTEIETPTTELVATEEVTEVLTSENETEKVSEMESDVSEEVTEMFTEPETEAPVQVEKQAYELTYSGEFKDLISVKEVVEADESSLEFTVKLSRTEETIFVMNYNTTEGDLVTVLTDEEGTKVPVAFLMSGVPVDLSEEDEDLFLSAQEAVNDIVASFKLK